MGRCGSAIVRVAGAMLVASVPMTPATPASIAPSRLTPDSIAPAPSKARPSIFPAPADLVPPEDSGALAVHVGHIVVEDGFAELAADTTEITSSLADRDTTLADLYAAANRIQRLYTARGYLLVRIVVPPQHLLDGADFRVKVVDGFIESVDASALPRRARRGVERQLRILVGRRHLRSGELERRLLLAGDRPGLTLRSALRRGSQNGGTQLVLDGRHDGVTISAGVDNRLPASVGTWEFTTSTALNDLFGRGEQLYLSVSEGWNLVRAVDGHPRESIVGAGAILPIGTGGLTINPEFIRAVSRPRAVPGTPAVAGAFDRIAVRAAYPLLRSMLTTVTGRLSYEHLSEAIRATDFGIDLSRDRYDVLRPEITLAMTRPAVRTISTSIVLSQGLGGRRAPAAADAVPVSRLAATPSFTKLGATLGVTNALPAQAQLAVTLRGQTSFGRPVFNAEQFSLDGLDAVSAFAQGVLNADEGLTLRAEVSRPVTLGGLPGLSPYLFGAAGWGRLDRATAAERTDLHAAGLGLGVRAARPVGSANGGLSMEVGRQFSNVISQRNGWRANIHMVLTL